MEAASLARFEADHRILWISIGPRPGRPGKYCLYGPREAVVWGEWNVAQGPGALDGRIGELGFAWGIVQSSACRTVPRRSFGPFYEEMGEWAPTIAELVELGGARRMFG